MKVVPSEQMGSLKHDAGERLGSEAADIGCEYLLTGDLRAHACVA